MIADRRLRGGVHSLPQEMNLCPSSGELWLRQWLGRSCEGQEAAWPGEPGVIAVYTAPLAPRELPPKHTQHPAAPKCQPIKVTIVGVQGHSLYIIIIIYSID